MERETERVCGVCRKRRRRKRRVEGEKTANLWRRRMSREGEKFEKIGKNSTRDSVTLETFEYHPCKPKSDKTWQLIFDETHFQINIFVSFYTPYSPMVTSAPPSSYPYTPYLPPLFPPSLPFPPKHATKESCLIICLDSYDMGSSQSPIKMSVRQTIFEERKGEALNYSRGKVLRWRSEVRETMRERES